MKFIIIYYQLDTYQLDYFHYSIVLTWPLHFVHLIFISFAAICMNNAPQVGSGMDIRQRTKNSVGKDMDTRKRTKIQMTIYTRISTSLLLDALVWKALILLSSKLNLHPYPFSIYMDRIYKMKRYWSKMSLLKSSSFQPFQLRANIAEYSSIMSLVYLFIGSNYYESHVNH